MTHTSTRIHAAAQSRTATRLIPSHRGVTPIGDVTLESGEVLSGVELAWESWGELNEAGNNAILVLHALTGDAHAHGTPDAPGWWDALIGPGRAADTRSHCVISINILGGCSGSTGPLSVNPQTGRAYAGDFPDITLRDSVRAERTLLEGMGVRRVAAVLGGSMGGARALEWAVTHPDMVERCAVIAATAASSAEQIALGGMQIDAVRLDPAFQDGFYDPAQPPVRGLSLARQIAHVSYRSEAELDFRFSRALQGDGLGHPRYAVGSYLAHQGRKLTERFDANSYIRLTEALMGHDVGRGRGGAAAALATTPAGFYVASVDSDRLYLPGQSEHLAQLAGVEAVSISAPNGHDAFLTHAHLLAESLEEFLRS